MVALAPYRVLDLTTERGWLCGKMLADLGADVVKVEPPGGDPGRRRGRFRDPAAPDPEENLEWWAYNRGKRSVVVDLDEPHGQERLRGLVKGSDLVVESFDPGWLEARRMGPDQLAAVNPQLVVTSISPFGGTGPKSGWAASDLVVAAASGLMWLSGDPDRPPVRISVPQLFRHASAEAAVGSLIALHHAQRSGAGQHVDVSAQCAGIRTLMNAQAFHLLEGHAPQRMGGFATYSHARFQMIMPCADGYVTMLPIGGALGGPMMRHLFSWAEREGVADPSVSDRDFATIDFSQEPAEFFDAVSATLVALFARYTKAELYQAALEHHLLLAPVATVADLDDDEQLAARGYFVPVEQQGGEAFLQVGRWARLSATPLRDTGRAPTVGEHDDDLAAEPTPRPADRRSTAGSAGDRAGSATGADDDQPFSGLKVFDMSWVGVGPMTAGYLAAYGATVVKVESSSRPDVLRLTPPFRDGQPGLNRSHFFGDMNADKLSVGIDLRRPEGRELAWRLLEWADVVLESFTPRALAGWGMAYDDIRRRNPGVVMLSTCMQGQTGPRRTYRGFGNLMASLAGYYHVTGWPDRAPAMVYGAYTDFISQRFCASALIAALDHRRRSGEGQHIDVSQYEAALQFLAPEILRYHVRGEVVGRDGNRDPDRAPHGAYPCRPARPGQEGWVAVACEDDGQWEALRSAIGLPDEPGWRSLAGRKADEDRLDALVTAWTADRSAAEVVDALQPRVACGPVASVPDLHDDPQVAHRGYWLPLEHPVYGTVPYSGMQAALSRTPGGYTRPAPCLGEHSFEVLADLLGLDPDEVARLLADEVVEITG
jgi:crotonobetainyl-CoA:carnitine CoA-transferase CaiB-like acyl-CoA transferase